MVQIHYINRPTRPMPRIPLLDSAWYAQTERPNSSGITRIANVAGIRVAVMVTVRKGSK